jgi:predicted HTH domain antitoxin
MVTTQNEGNTMVMISLTEEELETVRQLSAAEHLPEDILLRKWILDGLDRMRLERACIAYQHGELNLSGAAYYAGIGVEQMMRALTQRGIDHNATPEQFADGLEVLAELFSKGELKAAANQVRQQTGE